MTDVTLDTLLVKIGADTKPLSDALGGISKTANGSFSDIESAAAKASEGMARSLSGFVSGGKLGFEDLKSTALSVLGNIADTAIRSGLGSLLGSSASAFLSKMSSGVVSGLIGNFFAGRASGGPVSAGTPYVVGEYGRELFVPKVGGTVIPSPHAGQTHRAISVTVNVQGGGARSDMRQSAGQVASAVARSLARAERNL